MHIRPRSVPRVLAWRPACALAVLAATIGGLPAQTYEVPPLALTVAPQGGAYSDTVQVGDGYCRLRTTASTDAAYTWIRATLKATLLDSQGDEVVGPNGTGFVELSQASTVLGAALDSALGGTPAVPASYLDPSWAIDTTADIAVDNLRRMLLVNGTKSSTAVLGTAAMFAYASPATTIDYETTANHGWVLDADAAYFNLDALYQRAVYETVLPSLSSPNPRTFFNSSAYGKICALETQVGIAMVGVRGPAIVPSGAVADPTLVGFPSHAPKLAKSNRVFVRHGGTGQTATPPLHMMANGNQVPIYPILPNGLVVMRASGFSPDMEVAVFSEQALPQQPPLRVEATLQWHDYGKVEMQLPSLPTGFYQVRYFRRFVPDDNGGTYTAWQLIPVGKRARLQKL